MENDNAVTTLVTTDDLWPRLAKCFGFDPTGKYIRRFELVIERPLPVIRLELLVHSGNAMPFEALMEEFELHRKVDAGETALKQEAA